MQGNKGQDEEVPQQRRLEDVKEYRKVGIAIAAIHYIIRVGKEDVI
jgi:hypothetical protein